jgi:hypothetical protein
MPKHMDVGRSWRTPAKHDYMSSIIGQEVGVTRFLADAHRLVWPDLTAGDAAPVDGIPWEKGCSPGILARHAASSIKPVRIDLYEIKPSTYDRLLDNLALHLPALGYQRTDEERWTLASHVEVNTHNCGGQHAAVEHIGPNDAVFVFNDPNAITEWAMRATFAREIAERTWLFRSLSTMGCNTAGLKRLPLSERLSWFDLIAAQEAALPAYRDLLLASIARDEAQWAYLLCTSERWRKKTDAVVTSAFKRYGRTAELEWFRGNRSRFGDVKLRLFLRRAEFDRLDGRAFEWWHSTRDERLALLGTVEDSAPPNLDPQLTLFDFGSDAEASA